MRWLTLTTSACLSQAAYLSYKSLDQRNVTRTRSLFNFGSSKSENKEKPCNQLPLRILKDEKLELIQYATCPFCNKVRSYLDFYGIPYTLIEVCPAFKPEMKSLAVKKKKVPTVRIFDATGTETILQESSQIISLLHSYQIDVKNTETFPSLAEHFRQITENSDDLTAKYTIKNYGLNNQEKFRRELEWRKWADEKLVHVVAPNIYRSFGESLDSFAVITSKGNYGYDSYWAKPFTFMATWLGSTFMCFVIAPRLKKKNSLKENVRQSLYEHVNEWLSEVGGNKFHGGDSPDLADLAVFGVLRCMEDMDAFLDMLEYTNIGPWYGRMSKLCSKNSKQTHFRQISKQS